MGRTVSVLARTLMISFLPTALYPERADLHSRRLGRLAYLPAHGNSRPHFGLLGATKGSTIARMKAESQGLERWPIDEKCGSAGSSGGNTRSR